jgi:hypothetical protein
MVILLLSDSFPIDRMSSDGGDEAALPRAPKSSRYANIV